MKIVYVEARLGEDQKAPEALGGHTVIVLKEPLTPQTVTDEMKDADILTTILETKVDARLLDTMPKVKMVATRSTGFDHIDLEECAKRGITVTNVPSYGENTVAEHSFALILALSRKIVQSFERTERMDFTNRDGLQGFDLRGRTLGVVGIGNIGVWTARIGVAFGMEVIAYDVKHNDELAVSIGFTYVDSLEELLKRSDVISLHVPYLKATHHLINKENIKLIKRGAILVNTARGAVVDTEALLIALEEGILSGVGLDVFEGEEDLFEDIALYSKHLKRDEALQTLLQNHALIARNDVILTPHNAFNSVEAVDRLFQTNVHNIMSFIDGDPVNTVVKK